MQLGGTEAKILSEKLLSRVKDNRILLFLIQFLRNYSPGAVDEGNLASSLSALSQQELGIRVLMNLPPRLQEVYEDHRNHPDLIFESLVLISCKRALTTIAHV